MKHCRRHLNGSQKAAIALDMLPLLEEEAKERQRASGKDYGRGQETGTPLVEEAIPEKKKGAAAEHAGEIVGVSGRFLNPTKIHKL